METLSEAYREFYESECPIEAFPKVIRDVAKTYPAARNLPMELLCFRACGRRGSNHSRHRKTRMQGCLVFNLRLGGFVFKRNAP